MQSIIDDLIPNAITAIAAKTKIREVENNPNSKILGIYESYLSQFGPMAYQIGMRSTLAVYYNKEDRKRRYILELIFEVLKEKEELNFAHDTDFENWIQKILKDHEVTQSDEALLLDASIALKRAIRTFSLTDKKD